MATVEREYENAVGCLSSNSGSEDCDRVKEEIVYIRANSVVNNGQQCDAGLVARRNLKQNHD
jgi:hypothetical protein